MATIKPTSETAEGSPSLRRQQQLQGLEVYVRRQLAREEAAGKPAGRGPAPRTTSGARAGLRSARLLGSSCAKEAA